MMLKKLPVVLFASVLLAGCLDAGSSLPSMTSLSGGGDAKASGNLKKDSTQFAKLLSVGTLQLVAAVAKMQEAVGEADKSKALLAQAEEIKKAGKEPNTDVYKKTFEMINTSTVDKAALSNVPEKKGKKLLVGSAVHLGTGVAVDKKAIDLARKIVSAKPSVQDLMDGSLKVAIELAGMAIDVLPGHISKSGQYVADLNDYFSSHKLSSPGENEFKTEAGKSLSTEEMASIF